MQLLIPAAGMGTRFAKAGYALPKALIDVNGRPMINQVVLNMPPCRYGVVVCLERDAGALQAVLCDGTTVERFDLVPINGVTEGAACAIRIGLLYGSIDMDRPIIVANADQWLDWSPEHFVRWATATDCDGAITTFQASGPKWSYVQLEGNRVTMVKEKEPISTHATCGVYYWRKAGDLLDSIDSMIHKAIRVNGEFYLAPTYNEMLIAGAVVLAYPVPRMAGLGTPEDLVVACQTPGCLAPRPREVVRIAPTVTVD